MRSILKKIFDWNEMVGKIIHITGGVLIICGLVGLCFGITRCHKNDEVIETNIFLNEEFQLHDSNYTVIVNQACTVEEAQIKDKKGNDVNINGHFAYITLSISQNADSNMKPHTFDRDDFKIKAHTGVYLPLNDIGSILGWDLIDCHYDQKDNGFVISSADIKTAKSENDFNYIGKSISPGQTLDISIYIPISNKNVMVETSIIVFEIDFMFGGYFNSKKLGEDIILKQRPNSMIE